jgi:small subunit ribosomal protein S13
MKKKKKVPTKKLDKLEEKKRILPKENRIRHNKSVKINLYKYLQSKFGIGSSKTIKVCASLGVQPQLLVSKLNKTQHYQINKFLDTEIGSIEINLKRNLDENNLFLNNLKNNRSVRNKLGLPSRGQRTHTNAKTKKKLSKKG